MGNLRRNYNRFLARNRDKGIPRLVTAVFALSAVLYLFAQFTNNTSFIRFLEFDPALVLKGQIWRIFTYVLTFAFQYGSGTMGLIYLFFGFMFYNWIGNVLEGVMGRLRLNLYFFGGLLLMALYSTLVYLVTDYPPVPVSGYYAFLSLYIATATLIPEQQVYLFMILPIRMRWLALLDIILVLREVIDIVASLVVPYWGTFIGNYALLVAVVPLLPLVNYLLHFGRNVKNLFPRFSGIRRRNRQTNFRQQSQPQTGQASHHRTTARQAYRHKCTVCGRTDLTNPDLEFRYCSACRGYFCYCIDHIQNHTHVQ